MQQSPPCSGAEVCPSGCLSGAKGSAPLSLGLTCVACCPFPAWTLCLSPSFSLLLQWELLHLSDDNTMHLSISAVAHGEVGHIVDTLHFLGSEIDSEPNFRSLQRALVQHTFMVMQWWTHQTTWPSLGWEGTLLSMRL